MVSELSRLRKERRKLKKQQQKENAKLKRKLFPNIFVAPCCYCKVVFLMDELTIEHKIPRCLGGTNADANIYLACGPCNHQKGKEAWDTLCQLRKQRYQQYEQHSSQHY